MGKDKTCLGFGSQRDIILPPPQFHSGHPLPEMKKPLNLEQQLMVSEGRTRSDHPNSSQSDWTHYLGGKSTTPVQLTSDSSVFTEEEEEEEEEEPDDLSMLSDASSGPPHEECDVNGDNLCLTEAIEYIGKRRRRIEEEKQSFRLEDTASSSLFSFPKATSAAGCKKKKFLMEDINFKSE